EAARGDREEDVQQHGGPAAGHLVQRQGVGRREGEAPELRRADGRERLHREAGAAARRVVPARAQVLVTASATTEISQMLNLIDRRPSSRGKSAVNRERFLRRYKSHIQDAVKKMIGERHLADMERGGDVRVPKK